MKKRWFQLSLQRMLLSTVCVALTLGYWNWFWQEFHLGYFKVSPRIMAVFIGGWGFGTSVGVLVGKPLADVVVTSLCLVAILGLISV